MLCVEALALQVPPEERVEHCLLHPVSRPSRRAAIQKPSLSIRISLVHQITFAPSFAAWKAAARRALQQEIPPGAIHWQELGDDQPALALFDEAEDAPDAARRSGRPLPGAKSLSRGRPSGGLPPRPKSLGAPLFRPLAAHARRVTAPADRHGSGSRRALPFSEGGPSRRAQDACLRPLPRSAVR